MNPATRETKEQRNARVQGRYETLVEAGKHGHYETLFRVAQEEADRERDVCWREINAYVKTGKLSEPEHSERNGLVLAGNIIRLSA